MTLQIAVEREECRISDGSDICRRETYSLAHRVHGLSPVQRTLAAWHPSQALRSLEESFSNSLEFRVLSIDSIEGSVPSQSTETAA